MIYFYDGSRAGFLTAFLAAFNDNEAIVTSSQRQLTLGQEAVFVQTNAERAKKAEARLLSFDKYCMQDLNFLLRCSDETRDQTAFEYLRLIATKKRPVRNMLAEDAVIMASNLIGKVKHEAERFRGFVRFMESASGALYAPIAPDHDICDLLVGHFRARIPNFPFVIHDVKRKKATVYDGKNVFCAPLENAEVMLSATEEAWQALWKNYFEHVNIVERERLKQQRGYLPVRYRKFMPEFHD
ncbi:MAG: TIGR03915 family putative DNA repair protein [Clostridia bacterium]|nr:TIGR03915 family putative DNA repair protein [Clostridia bacterium]MDE6677181.1 TIGR03915 family putative DNA repair protein [Clostridia bacterium]